LEIAVPSDGAVSAVDAASMDPAELAAVAELLYDSFAEFYDLLPCGHDDLRARLSAQIGMAGTEIERVFVHRVGGAIAGCAAVVPARALPAAQVLSTMRLLKGLKPEGRDRFLTDVKALSGSLPAPPDESLYLSRIAVAQPFRGTAVGADLLGAVLSVARSEQHRAVSAHVHADNHRALAFYRKQGFHVPAAGDGRYLCIVRSLGD
jgi:ribosomal protein S18 acetylase RimI-like enzyme